MDHMRRDEIVAEIEGYQHKIRIGFSSVTVGDVVQLISEVERLQEELGLARKQRSEFAQSGLRLEAERDAALAEVERLKGELRDTRWDRDAMTARHKQAQTKIKRLEQELAAEKTVTDWQDREIKKEEIRLTERMDES